MWPVAIVIPLFLLGGIVVFGQTGTVEPKPNSGSPHSEFSIEAAKAKLRDWPLFADKLELSPVQQEAVKELRAAYQQQMEKQIESIQRALRDAGDPKSSEFIPDAPGFVKKLSELKSAIEAQLGAEQAARWKKQQEQSAKTRAEAAKKPVKAVNKNPLPETKATATTPTGDPNSKESIERLVDEVDELKQFLQQAGIIVSGASDKSAAKTESKSPVAGLSPEQVQQIRKSVLQIESMQSGFHMLRIEAVQRRAKVRRQERGFQFDYQTVEQVFEKRFLKVLTLKQQAKWNQLTQSPDKPATPAQKKS